MMPGNRVRLGDESERRVRRSAIGRASRHGARAKGKRFRMPIRTRSRGATVLCFVCGALAGCGGGEAPADTARIPPAADAGAPSESGVVDGGTPKLTVADASAPAVCADISQLATDPLYPYLSRSQDILGRLKANIAADAIDPDAFVRSDSEAEASEYEFLCASLSEEIAIARTNASTTWQRFDVTKYGADPSGSQDSLAAFDAALKAAMAYGDLAEVWVPKGKYSMSKAFRIVGARNLRVTADDAELNFTAISDGLWVQDDYNVKISGFSIDFAQLPWTQATLVRIDGSDIYVRIDPGYAPIQPWHNARLRFYDGGSGLEIHSAYRWAYDKPNLAVQADGTVKLPALAAEVGRMPLAQIPLGSKVVILSRNDDSYNFASYFNNNDWDAAISVAGSQYVTFQGINVYSAFGADIFTVNCSGLKFMQVNIEPRPGTDRLVDGNTDTLCNYTGRKGHFIYQSKIRSGSDDGTNFSSLMIPVVSWKDANTLVVTGSLAPTWNPFRVGDGMWIVNAAGGPFTFFAKIVALTDGGSNTVVLGLDRPAPAAVQQAAGNMVQGINSKLDGTIILDNEFSNGTSTGIKMYASNITVENNRLNNFYYTDSLFELDPSAVGGATRNMLYTRNQVDSFMSSNLANVTSLASPAQYVFRHWIVSQNQFGGGAPISLTNAADITISNNTFAIPGGGSPLTVTNSRDATIRLLP